jgi:hypothetical protein
MSLLDDLKKQTQAATETVNSFKSAASGVGGDLVKAVGVPVEVERDGGKLRLYIMVDPEAVSDPRILNAVLDNIEEKFNLAVWKPRSQQNDNGGFKRQPYQKRW